MSKQFRPVVASNSDPLFVHIANVLNIPDGISHYKLEFHAGEIVQITSTQEMMAAPREDKS